jgi:hypothetical protein
MADARRRRSFSFAMQRDQSGAGVLDLSELLLPKIELRITSAEGKHGVGQGTIALGT